MILINVWWSDAIQNVWQIPRDILALTGWLSKFPKSITFDEIIGSLEPVTGATYETIPASCIDMIDT